MSVAGSELMMLQREAMYRRLPSGFTLLEMLLVMMLATLLLTLVPASFSAAVPRLEQQSEVQQLLSRLRYARGMAIRERREITLVLDLRHQRYQLEGAGSAHHLPATLVIYYTSPFSAAALSVEPVVPIRFYADGSSSGGTIALQSGDERYHIAIDWLTGRVSYREPS